MRSFAGQSAYSYWFVLGNRLLTTTTNVLFNCYIQDMETGFKEMRTELMRRLSLHGDRFDIEPEITARILRLGYRIHEVPITYYARSRAEGKKAHLGPYHGQRLKELSLRPRLPQLPEERAA